MVSIQGTDFQSHELRNVSPGFKNALAQWRIDAPNDKLFCTLHGKMETISLYVPESIAYKRDRIEEDQETCGHLEEAEKDRIDRDLAAGRTRRLCGNSHK